MRIIVKVGTKLVTDERHQLDKIFLKNLAQQIASLIGEGHEVILVSSGAIAAGRSEVQFEKEKKSIPYRQVLAAVGQNLLMRTYHELFGEFKIPVAQALLTNYDFTNRENFLNTKNVLEELLRSCIVPIVNENDVTTIAELKFGDNDMLSAKTAGMVSADLLILLTTVDGLFTADPAENEEAKFINFVESIDAEIFQYAGKKIQKGSLGGMVSKLTAAEYASSSGVAVFIGNGRKTSSIRQMVSEYLAFQDDTKPRAPFSATFFLPQKNEIAGFKKWMKPQIVKGAKIIVDQGCCDALMKKGKSLLPSGIQSVEGEFSRGDVVEIVSLDGEKIGYGQSNYGKYELVQLRGKNSSEIEKTLGYAFEDEAIHRDRLVVL